MARAFAHVSEILGVGPTRFYLFADRPGGLAHQPVYPLASVSGASLLSGVSPATMIAHCAEHLAYLHPNMYLATLVRSQADLQELFRVVLVVGGAPSASELLRAAAARLKKRARPVMLETIERLLPMIQVHEQPLDAALASLARNYLESCRRIAACVALIATSSVVATLECLEQRGTRAELEHVVLQFAASEQYAAIRPQAS